MTARVTLLDGFGLRLSGSDAPAMPEDLPHSVQRLVAHLSISARPLRAAVAGQLWPDVPEDHAHGSLRSALWRLNKVAPGLVEVSGGCLTLADGVLVDIHELGEWARRVMDPACSLEQLEVGESAIQGELLPGWYDDWVLLERERLRQLRLHALERVAIRLAAAGRYSDALQAAFSVARAEPLRESAHRMIVEVHLAEGNISEALRAYENFRALLADELGVQPTQRLVRLVEGLREPVSSAAAESTLVPARTALAPRLQYNAPSLRIYRLSPPRERTPRG
ncbi:BTAD domain-containing putative transcriptional regulator [Naasia sp. SYSU D00948]|uniref:AfsR/SARP family transcriptional regulator n=1 Tax=Naasia sp. SYSU D00948 TaxID=2817379 RepID=UPI001B3039DE|nr:BTAD domain-containing putative transcriptional regulator [Naasia sp. SYSU D00948]